MAEQHEQEVGEAEEEPFGWDAADVENIVLSDSSDEDSGLGLED